MTGVWHFDKEGVARRETGGVQKLAALVFRPTNEEIKSYAELEARLRVAGWTRLEPAKQAGTLEFHKGPSSNDLITLPSDVRSLQPMHLLDIAMKNRDYFEVRNLN